MVESFITVLNPSTALYVEKKSKFWADTAYVSSEEAAMAFFGDVRVKYKDASHNAYAYSISGGKPSQRFSDGGEPSGTAGIPILEIIKKRHLTNTIVVVTRYFGGILLGAHGLARAYGKSAALGLDAAGTVTMVPAVSVAVTCGYSELGLIQSRLPRYPFKITDIRFSEHIEIVFSIPLDSKTMFKDVIGGLTDGTASIAYGIESFDIF